MPFVLIPILVLAAIVVVGVVLAGGSGWRRKQVAVHDELAGPAATLDYEVPPGQDPAVLMAALRDSGYEAAPDPRRTNLLHIECPAGVDRERPRVRATLQEVRTTAIDTGAPMDPEPVRFTDEA